MGVHNRQRRQQKKARQAREHRAARSAGRARTTAWTAATEGVPVGLAIREAAEARFHRRSDAAELLELVMAGPPIANGRRMVARELLELIEQCICQLARAHWTPGELARQARRKAGAQAELVVASAIRSVWRAERGRSERDRDPAWASEAAALAADGSVPWRPEPAAAAWRSDVALCLAVLGVLMHLPALHARQTARPAAGQPLAVDERILEKVRNLLSKAESTTFSDEADALTAKAQELLARYSIDSAVLHLATPRQRAQAAVRRVWIDDPYVMAKAHLLHVVGEVNRCRTVITESLGLATLVGHDDDVEAVEILFTSLLVQATTQMTAAGRKEDRFGRSRTRSFRQSFLVAYAARIGQRLRAVQEEAVSAAAARHGNELLPVLARRSWAADEVVERLFPAIVGHRTAANDYEGWVAGTAAADLANLSYQPELSDVVA